MRRGEQTGLLKLNRATLMLRLYVVFALLNVIKNEGNADLRQYIDGFLVHVSDIMRQSFQRISAFM